MKIIRPLALAGLLAMAAALPAIAVPILYVGNAQIGSIATNYTITTDGKLGLLTGQDILSFSLTLTDSRSSETIGTATGGTADGDIYATQTNLLGIDNPAGLQLGQQNGTGGFLGSITFGSLTTRATIEDNAGYRATGGATPNPVATAVPAIPAPEPATAAMMVVGLGVLGAAGRRRPKKRTPASVA